MRENIIERTSKTVQRVHDSISTELVLTVYEWDDSAGQNEYADGDWNSDEVVITGTVRESDSDFTTDAEGSEVSHDVTIWLHPKYIDYVNVGEDDRSRASEFLETRTGNRYRAVALFHQDSLIKIECTEL